MEKLFISQKKDILAEIEIEYRPSEENDKLLDNNGISISHISLSIRTSKMKLLNR